MIFMPYRLYQEVLIMTLARKILISFAAMLMLLCSACAKESEEDKYFALLEEIYGAGFVVKFPQQEGYGVLRPYSFPDDLYIYAGREEDCLLVVPLENLAGNEWHFSKQFEEYSGDDIVLAPTEASFKKGSIITFILTNNRPDPSDKIVHTHAYHIEMLVDGKWNYVGSTDPPGMVGADDILPYSSYTITLDHSTLNNKMLYKYKEEGKNYIRYHTARDVILPVGKYRITKIIDRPELCSLTCEFEITE